jgi:hypothetical protein
MVDRILKHDRDAVIVLQGDHGPRSEMNFESHEDSNLREGMAILNAIRLPGNASDELHAAISPVNSFRVVLNHLFAFNLELLPNRSYFETGPYQFVDVTDATSAQTRPSSNPTLVISRIDLRSRTEPSAAVTSGVVLSHNK